MHMRMHSFAELTVDLFYHRLGIVEVSCLVFV